MRQKPFYKKPLFIVLIIGVVLAIVIASIFFAFMIGDDGGTSNEKKKFLHTWELTDSSGGYSSGYEYTFYDNGTYLIEYSGGYYASTSWGDWSLNADDNTITMDGATVNYEFSNNGDTLELSASGTTLTLQKQ